MVKKSRDEVQLPDIIFCASAKDDEAELLEGEPSCQVKMPYIARFVESEKEIRQLDWGTGEFICAGKIGGPVHTYFESLKG